MIRVSLIETAPPELKGSMSRYAALIEQAMRGTSDLKIQRIALAPGLTRLQSVPRRLRMAAHHCLIALRAASTSWSGSADLYHIIDGSHGYISRWLPRARTIVTAHDIIPELQARGCFPLPPPRPAARWLIRASLRGVAQVARVVAVSQSTANDLCKYGNVARDRINVVPLALLQECLPTDDRRSRDGKFECDEAEPFMFHIGNNGFYKNRPGVVRIFDLVRQRTQVRLRLAGPPPDSNLISLIRERKLESLIDFVHDPDDETVIDYYRTARLLLFPSLYEGFGWPPLEAMAWGCPVVCSTQGSLPEVVGSSALIADANDEAKLAEHCLSVMRDQSVSSRLSSAGIARAAEFSLDRFKENLLKVYRSVSAANKAL